MTKIVVNVKLHSSIARHEEIAKSLMLCGRIRGSYVPTKRSSNGVKFTPSPCSCNHLCDVKPSRYLKLTMPLSPMI
jgi:hypothetical protein